jgi:NADPH:quinone reductase-like Zn-dependent oxidoreductase
MKAACIERYGKHAPLIIGDRPVPTCGPRDLLVRVRAASINPIDFKIRNGELRVLFKFRMPLILGSDLAGEVIQVGSEVQGSAVGDEIMARAQKERIGSFAEQIAIDASTAARKPKALRPPNE